MSNSTRAVLALLDQLSDAINAGNGDRAVLVLRSLHTVAGDTFYRHLIEHLMLRGLTRITATSTN